MKKANNQTPLYIILVIFCLAVFYFYNGTQTNNMEKQGTVIGSDNKPTTNLNGFDTSALFDDLDVSEKIKTEQSKSKVATTITAQKSNNVANLQKLKEDKKQQLEQLKKRAKIEPLVPEGFDWKERKIDYPGVTSVRSFHPVKDVSIETLVSENSLSDEDKEEALQTLFRSSSDDFEPLIGYELKNKNLNDIFLYQLDDENTPIFLITAKVNGREVYFGISGSMSDISSELEKIKKTFSNLEVEK